MPDELAERVVDSLFPDLKPKPLDPKAPPTDSDIKKLASNPSSVGDLAEAVRKNRQMRGRR